METIELIIAGLALLMSSGLLLYILKIQNAKIDIKVDKTLCEDRVATFRRELERGQGSFAGLQNDIKLLTAEQGKTNETLARLDQSVKDWTKKNGS